jgi:hypothetical protein
MSVETVAGLFLGAGIAVAGLFVLYLFLRGWGRK